MSLAEHQTPRPAGVRLLAPYRSLFATPGASVFAVAGLIGRFPLSMLGLGTVLLVSGLTGSYGLAGAVSATLAVSTSVAGPVVGSLGDRRGQQPVLIAGLVAHLVGVAALVTAAVSRAPHWMLFPAAVLAGASLPQIGSFVRARWSALVGGTGKLHTAFSLESVFDEVVFVVGPVLATVLATVVWPAAGVVGAAVLAAVGGLLLASQRRTQPDLVPRTPGRSASAIHVPGLRLIVAVYVLVGTVFGAIDVSMVAFADDEGSRAAAGFLLAAVAFASLVAGLCYGVARWRRPLHQQFLLALGGLTLGTVPLAVAPTIAAMAPAGLLVGVAIAPMLVAGVGLVEALVPASARTEGFAWISTSIGFGVAVGATVSGRIADAAGGHRGFLVPVGTSALAFAVAMAGRRYLRRPVATVPDARVGHSEAA